MTTGCPDTVLCQTCAEEIGWCMEAVIPTRWQRAVRQSTSMHVPGIVAARLQTAHPDYVPFKAASEANAVSVLTNMGFPESTSTACVRGAWWTLRMAGQDVTLASVVRLAERACTYRDGFLSGYASAREAAAGLVVNV